MSEKKTNPLTGMASSMTDGMEMMRRMWGMTGLPQIPQFPTPAGIAQFAQGLPQALPSMITPTLDLGELDKRIADLRAVEQWLNLNATMLRTTIQTLEVQRNTIATLKSLGGSMLASMNTRGSAGEATMSALEAARAVGSAFGRQESTDEGARKNAQTSAADEDWPPQRLRHDLPARAGAQAPKAAKPRAVKSKAARGARTGSSKSAAATPVNAAAWWGALQDQFARVAAAAVTPPLSAAKSAAGKSAAGASKEGKAAASKAAMRKAVRNTAQGKAAARPRRKATDSSD